MLSDKICSVYRDLNFIIISKQNEKPTFSNEIILKFCNTALLHRKKSSQWSLANIIPIPKTEDLSLGRNYRDISLSSLVQKTYNKMILHRIRSKVDPWLRIYQNGFRPGQTTVSQILALRRIIEVVKENNLSCIITFIDFKKAFYSIHRGKILCILKAYGIPESLVNAIEGIYSDTKAKVLSLDGETKYFSITAGVYNLTQNFQSQVAVCNSWICSTIWM